MKTLTQIFYHKFCECPMEMLRSEKGRELIEKAALQIRQKDGEEEERYFRNLMIISEIIQ